MGSSFSSCAIMEEAPVVVMVWNVGSRATSASDKTTRRAGWEVTASDPDATPALGLSLEPYRACR